MPTHSKFNIKLFLQKILICLSVLTIIPNASAQVWATATSKHRTDDRVIVFRYLKEFKNGYDVTQYPDRVILTWTYFGNKGMPSKDERVKMDKLEDTLQPLLDKNNLATLTIVSTGNNVREWKYYARSGDSFKHALDLVLKEFSDLSLEFQSSRDPEWTAYKSFKATVKE
ncbi:DUF695 domain-containing protein [Undibacterium sp. Ji83W]|uniref:DUF695 domain-containing protein n=1 Tax=Undibacterium sp. Ji83W TaxID=3413043 RepID=UPI003BF5F6F7